MSPRARLLALCLVPVLYVAVSAVRASGGSSSSIAALVLLPVALHLAFRLSEPRTIGEDLVGDAPRLGFRLTLAGLSLYLAARGAGPGRPAYDAAAALGVGLGVSGALFALARIPEGRGLVAAAPAARRLDAVAATALVSVIAATVAAAAALAPRRGTTIDPLTIDYAMVAEGAAALLLLTLSTLRLRVARRLELGVVDRASAAFALAATALAVSAPASLLRIAPPDRVLPGAALLAAAAASLALVIPDPTAVSRSLRTLLVVCVLGTPIALFTAAVAAAAPKQAGATVLVASVLLLLVGVFAQILSRRFRPDAARWLDAISKAQQSAAIPEPTSALRETLASLRDRLGPSSPSPVLYRLEAGDMLSVDRAGYLHEAPGSLPAELLSFCDAEPEQTFRLEVARAIEIRHPEVRPTLAWMEAHGYACATALRDEDGPVGVLVLPRARRRSPLTLDEVLALGELSGRLGSVFSLTAAMASARKRQLQAEAEAKQLAEQLAQIRTVLARQGERYATHARRAIRQAPLGRYSPAARLAEQQIEQAARSSGPLVLLAPHGVPVDAFAAAVHLQSDRRDYPFVVVNGADAREHPMTHWLDQVSSPFLLAHGGTLVVVDLPALPHDVQRLLARLIRSPHDHDWKAAWLEAPATLDVFLVAGVRETTDTLVARGRLVEDLADALGPQTIPLPSLEARPEDLRTIALEHLTRLGFALRGSPIGIADDALALLVEHTWPLNDEELATLLHRAASSTASNPLRAADLRRAGFSPLSAPHEEPPSALSSALGKRPRRAR